MIIAIDGNEANIKNRVGINQFAFEVIWGIYKLKVKGQKPKAKSATKKLEAESIEEENGGKDGLFEGLKFLVFLNSKPGEDLPPETDWWRYEVFGPKKFWTWTGLVKRLYWGRPRPDVLFSPSHYGPGFSPIPFLVSIMDLGFLRWPNQFTKKDFYQLKYWTARSAKRAKKIITISRFSKQDIVKTYGVDRRKVAVAYPGYTKIQNSKLKIKNYNSNLKIVKEKYAIRGKYILYLGTMKPSKNIEGLVGAYKILDEQGKVKNTKLVIAGKKGWLYQGIFERTKQLELENRIVFTGFVPDEETFLLVKGAAVFVLPSFWEGFGIPVVEAMKAGTPVVCAKAGALPEVAGGAALLVDPRRPKDIAEKIGRVLANGNLRQSLIKKGKERAKAFSWEKCSTIILREVIAGLTSKK